jgi:hypothetical protein
MARFAAIRKHGYERTFGNRSSQGYDDHGQASMRGSSFKKAAVSAAAFGHGNPVLFIGYAGLARSPFGFGKPNRMDGVGGRIETDKHVHSELAAFLVSDPKFESLLRFVWRPFNPPQMPIVDDVCPVPFLCFLYRYCAPFFVFRVCLDWGSQHNEHRHQGNQPCFHSKTTCLKRFTSGFSLIAHSFKAFSMIGDGAGHEKNKHPLSSSG